MPLKRTLSISLSAVVLLGAASSARAATYVADPSIPDTSTTTCAPDGSLCSLRQAVTAANGADGNTVTVNAGTYSLTAGALPNITHNMTITGAGEVTTTLDLSGNGTTNGFVTLSGNGNTVDLTGVTVTGSQANTTFTVGATTTLSMSDARVIDTTGTNAFYVFNVGGTLGLHRVSVTDNATSFEAVLTTGASAVVDVDHTTFARNTTGSVINMVSAAGMAPSLTLSNSTLADNQLTGPQVVTAGNVSGNLAFDTITGDTAGLEADTSNGSAPTLTLQGTVIARSTAAAACVISSATSLTDDGSNLSSDGTCGLTQPSDLPSTAPKLAAVADNGGPVQTQAPQAGSPVVNAAGTSCSVTTDARGIARPQGSACDIGAFEEQAPAFSGDPTVTGSTQVGHTLTCTAPSLATSDGPPVVTLTWLRDGTQVATGGSYTTTTADVGHNVGCAATATNAAASATVTSTPSTITNPPPPPTTTTTTTTTPTTTTTTPTTTTPPPTASVRAPRVTLKLVAQSLKAIIKSKRVLISVQCDETCAVTTAVSLGKVVIGSGTGSLTANHATVVSVPLTAAGLKLLSHSRRAKLRITISAVPAHLTTIASQPITAKR